MPSRSAGAWFLCAFMIPVVAVGTPAIAQDYPAKSLRLLVGFPPGGGVDTLARLFAPRLAERLGQPVVIDNRAGAGGNIAFEILAKAPGDGYTVLLTTPTITVNPALYKQLSFDPLRDLAPVALVATGIYVLVVHPSLPVHSVKDLVTLAKARPGQINYSSSGNGGAGHLAGALFGTTMGLDIVHVPYKGIASAVVSLLSGETQFAIASTPSVLPHIKSGKLRALAVSSLKRSRYLPDLPSMAESGVPNYETTAWYGILVPAQTPRTIINRINAELVRIFDLPEIRTALARERYEVGTSTPEVFARLLREETAKWAAVVKQTRMKVD